MNISHTIGNKNNALPFVYTHPSTENSQSPDDFEAELRNCFLFAPHFWRQWNQKPSFVNELFKFAKVFLSKLRTFVPSLFEIGRQLLLFDSAKKTPFLPEKIPVTMYVWTWNPLEKSLQIYTSIFVCVLFTSKTARI